MAEEKKDETKEEKKDETLSFKTADDLTNFLIDLKGRFDNMQETIDKLSPVEEEAKKDEQVEEKELSDDEVSEIDKLLQSE